MYHMKSRSKSESTKLDFFRMVCRRSNTSILVLCYILLLDIDILSFDIKKVYLLVNPFYMNKAFLG